jgi:hypothetical protein
MGLSRGFKAVILWVDIVKARVDIFEALAATTLRGTVDAILRSIVEMFK